MIESKCRSRIHIFHYLSSSYSEKIGCISGVNTRTSSVGGIHVRRLFWLPMSCMSSSKSIISSLFASHVYSPYSIQTDSKPSVNTTNSLIWRKLCFNPYSKLIRCMSNANTRISSLAVSNVNRLCHRMALCQSLNTYSLRWVKSF